MGPKREAFLLISRWHINKIIITTIIIIQHKKWLCKEQSPLLAWGLSYIPQKRKQKAVVTVLLMTLWLGQVCRPEPGKTFHWVLRGSCKRSLLRSCRGVAHPDRAMGKCSQCWMLQLHAAVSLHFSVKKGLLKRPTAAFTLLKKVSVQEGGKMRDSESPSEYSSFISTVWEVPT